MTTHSLKQSDLTQFNGTEVWYQHSLVKNIRYTEGVQNVAKHGGAYWLIDEIAFLQSEPAVKAEPFQLWVLLVGNDRTAQLFCEDGNDLMVFKKNIEYTDFPLDEISFYFTDNTILLPSEY